jgi:hypothetical protein
MPFRHDEDSHKYAPGRSTWSWKAVWERAYAQLQRGPARGWQSADWEDMAQDAVCKAIIALQDGTVDEGQFDQWFAVLVRNLARDYWRIRLFAYRTWRIAPAVVQVDAVMQWLDAARTAATKAESRAHTEATSRHPPPLCPCPPRSYGPPEKIVYCPNRIIPCAVELSEAGGHNRNSSIPGAMPGVAKQVMRYCWPLLRGFCRKLHAAEAHTPCTYPFFHGGYRCKPVSWQSEGGLRG